MTALLMWLIGLALSLTNEYVFGDNVDSLPLQGVKLNHAFYIYILYANVVGLDIV